METLTINKKYFTENETIKTLSDTRLICVRRVNSKSYSVSLIDNSFGEKTLTNVGVSKRSMPIVIDYLTKLSNLIVVESENSIVRNSKEIDILKKEIGVR